jgi:hypothetical protein
MLFAQSVAFSIPAGDNTLASEIATIPDNGPINAITILPESVVADSVIELWLKKVKGTQGTGADYYFYESAVVTTGKTWFLAGWQGAQIKMRSGTGTGTSTLSIVAN